MTNTVVLSEDAVYDIGGKVYSLRELQQHAIDSEQYCKMLHELKGDSQ